MRLSLGAIGVSVASAKLFPFQLLSFLPVVWWHIYPFGVRPDGVTCSGQCKGSGKVMSFFGADMFKSSLPCVLCTIDVIVDTRVGMKLPPAWVPEGVQGDRLLPACARPCVEQERSLCWATELWELLPWHKSAYPDSHRVRRGSINLSNVLSVDLQFVNVTVVTPYIFFSCFSLAPKSFHFSFNAALSTKKETREEICLRSFRLL